MGTGVFRSAEFSELADRVGIVSKIGWSPNQIFYVHASDGASGNDGLTKSTPLATIEQAMNKCTASKGDVIMVMPGHAESITNATDLVCDKEGVTVLGCGVGRNKPVITLNASTTAIITISGASTRLSNLVFLAGLDEIVTCLDINAHDVEIDNCVFDYGGTTTWNFRTYISVSGFDRCYIHDNWLWTESATAGAEKGIVLIDALNSRVIRNTLLGTWDTNVFNSLTTVSTLIDVDGNRSYNASTADNGSFELAVASTGIVSRNLIGSLDNNGVANLLDGGSCILLNNHAADTIDESSTFGVNTTSA